MAGSLVITSGGQASPVTDLSTTLTGTSATIVSSTGTDATLVAANALTAGLLLPAEKTKLTGVEAGATNDQTGGEIVTSLNAELGGTGWQSGGGAAAPTDLSYTASTREIASSTGANTILPEVSVSLPGLSSAADKTKLDGIEASADVNPTDAEIVASINTELGGTTWQSGSASVNTIYANILDFGGVADGVTDNSTAFNSARDSLLATGGTVFYPRGDWFHNSTLTITTTATSDLGARISIMGEGQGSTRLLFGAGAVNGITLQGDSTPNTAGLQSYQSIKHLSIGRNAAQGTGGGVTGDELAFISFVDLKISGWDTALSFTDILSCEFQRCNVRWNLRGCRLERASKSDPNAIRFSSCVFGHNAVYGLWIIGGAGIVFDGGSIENNGTTGGAGGEWGILLTNSGLEGAVGLIMNGVYIEGNAGVADVWIKNTSPGVAFPMAHAFTGVSFTRMNSSLYTTNCLRIESDNGIKTNVALSGCGFKSYNDYAPSAARPTVFWSGDSVVVSNGNCMFEDAVDTPTFPSSGGGATNLAKVGTSGVITITSDTGTDAVIPLATSTTSGVFSASNYNDVVEIATKLQGIEQNATADQTGGEIVSLVNGQLGTAWQQGSLSNAQVVTAVNTQLGSTVWQGGGGGVPVHGSVASNGTGIWEIGGSWSKQGTGRYRMTFSSPISNPSPIGTAVGQGINVGIWALSSSYVEFITTNSSGTAVDASMACMVS